jgi:hypothetical protein
MHLWRWQHYQFAHRTLPGLILGNWDSLRPVFDDGLAEIALRDLWLRIGDGQNETDPGAAGFISVERVCLGDRHGYLIEFPDPVAVSEAAMALIPDRPAPTRYFVLEVGQDVDDRRCWSLCEWVEDRHVNLGPVCEEDLPPNMLSIGAQQAKRPMIEKVTAILESESIS